jgi:two-component system phosphate regulon response regulator PhoB
VAIVAHEEAVCRRLLERLLERSGFQVRLAAGVEQACDALRAQHTGGSLVGIISGSDTGMEILKGAIRDSGPGCARWVVVTDEWRQADCEAARSLGAQEFITRPFSPAHLLGRIREWMQATNEEARVGTVEAPLGRTSTVEE